MEQGYIGFVAAGTGGHINAAKALGYFFEQSGHKTVFFSGQRILDYRLFSDKKVYFLPGKTLRNKSIIHKVFSLFWNFAVWFKAIDILTQYRPKALIGAGGYICGPTLLAGFFLGIPVYILEQNSIAGMTNRLLAIFSSKIFTNFKSTKRLEFVTKKTIVSGNPINKLITEGDFSFSKNDKKEKINILVVGGSLGAAEINSMIEQFIQSEKAHSVHIRHQTGINKNFNPANVQCIYEQLDYIDDMSREYKWADLIICRAGASTLSELRYVQRPSLLIPYPYATDNHQQINAELFRQEVDFAVYIYSGKRLVDNNFALLKDIIDHNEIDRQYRQKDLSSIPTAQEIIYKECLYDF